MTAHQLQQSGNQSPRSPTHSTIICALEKSVPFVLGYSSIQRPWEEASERTRRFYVRKAGQGLSTILQDIASRQSIPLVSYKEEATSSSVNETMMSALADGYRAADSWETRWQILLIMANKSTLNQLRHWIPDLSQYRLTEARRHCLICGRGVPVLTVSTPRMRVSTA